MRRRFYAPPEQFAPGGATVALAREETLHLRNVLRLKAGDEVFVFDGAGREYLCVVAAAHESGSSGGRVRAAETATLEVRGQVEPERAESPLDLTLAVALLKGEKFDLVVQKATELGVWRIVPVLTARSDVRLREGREASTERVARWRRIALEAAKQSGRARLAEILAPVAFASLVEEGAGATASTAAAAAVAAQRLFFTERGGRGLADAARVWRAGARPAKLIALVGPEGGWDDEEIARASAAGWVAITFGGRVLRAETAAIVVAGLLQHLCGDLV